MTLSPHPPRTSAADQRTSAADTPKISRKYAMRFLAYLGKLALDGIRKKQSRTKRQIGDDPNA